MITVNAVLSVSYLLQVLLPCALLVFLLLKCAQLLLILQDMDSAEEALLALEPAQKPRACLSTSWPDFRGRVQQLRGRLRDFNGLGLRIVSFCAPAQALRYLCKHATHAFQQD